MLAGVCLLFVKRGSYFLLITCENNILSCPLSKLNAPLTVDVNWERQNPVSNVREAFQSLAVSIASFVLQYLGFAQFLGSGNTATKMPDCICSACWESMGSLAYDDINNPHVWGASGATLSIFPQSQCDNAQPVVQTGGATSPIARLTRLRF